MKETTDNWTSLPKRLARKQFGKRACLHLRGRLGGDEEGGEAGDGGKEGEEAEEGREAGES